MHFSAGQEVRFKNYGAQLFLSTVFKHGLLEGSTFLFQYSFITHRKLESSRLSEIKYALLAGYDVRLKKESLRKGERMTFYDRRKWSLYYELLEGSTLLFQYSYPSRALLDSSRLGE